MFIDEKQILEEAVDGIIAADEIGQIVFSNAAAESALRRPLPKGTPLADIMPVRLRSGHHNGFDRYVKSGKSNLEGKTVRVPALGADGQEHDIDLTIRIFQRPDGSRLAVASVLLAASGNASEGLLVIESKLAARAYQLL